MENWQIEMNRLNKIRLDLGLNWNKFGKLVGKNRELLKKYFEFRSIPSMKVYFDLKTALENEFEVKIGEVVVPEFPDNRNDYTTRTLSALNSQKDQKVIKDLEALIPPKTSTRNTNYDACDCKLENGLLKRGKIKCKKTKAEHNF